MKIFLVIPIQQVTKKLRRRKYIYAKTGTKINISKTKKKKKMYMHTIIAINTFRANKLTV